MKIKSSLGNEAEDRTLLLSYFQGNRLKTSTGAFHSSRLLTTDNFDFRRVLVVFYSTHSRFETTKKPALAS